MKKINIFILAALAAALLPVSCQMEEPAEELTYTVNVPLVFGDNPTAEDIEADDEVKADVDGESGLTTWTTGDQIAFWVSGAGANKYQVKTASGGLVTVSLVGDQERDDFAVYPPASANATFHTAANLKVTYPTTYNFSGMTALQMATFSPLPMVGDNNNNTSNIVFYNVGGLLRLTVNNVPAAAKYIKVTVPGMNITGDYTVKNPTTTEPYVETGSGSNDNVTFQIAETTIGTQGNYTVNLPLPAGNYSGVTGKTITVEALNGSSSSIAAAGGAITHWTTLGRRKGKKLTVDFAPASFAINEGEATIWKSQTANFTTNATAGSVTWNSSTPTVATVNASGTVTGVSAGYTDITATLNGIKVSEPVRVYVNAVTGVTLDTEDSKYKVGPSSIKTLIATLSHTSNGAITTYPTVTWESVTTTYITVSPASSTAVYATDGTATATTTATGVTKGGSSICKVTVPGSFSDNNLDREASVTLTCQNVTTITYPDLNGNGLKDDGEPYKFRGYYMHPGVLFWNGTSFSITSGEDPLELLQHYYYDSQTTKFDGSSGTAWVNACYFTWTQLAERLGTDSNGNINGTVSANHPGTTTSYSWRIPTGSGGEWSSIITGDPSLSITLNGTTVTNSSLNYVKVRVELNVGSDAPSKYIKKGLSAANKAGYSAWQTGILLIPDGASISCSKIPTTIDDYFDTIDWDDLVTLTEGGCVLLVTSGHCGYEWSNGGSNGMAWSATKRSDSNADCLDFTNAGVYLYAINKNLGKPVKLIRN